MSRIRVTNLIKIYEVNDKELGPRDDAALSVESHWNQRSMVVLVVDGKRHTVNAKDMKAAIDNAMNAGDW